MTESLMLKSRTGREKRGKTSSVIVRFVPPSIAFQSLVSLMAVMASLSGCKQRSSRQEPSTINPTPAAICQKDPRVSLGLVSPEICAGARVFFDEEFNGNGRRCGSCHPAANNYTLDRTEIGRLQAERPNHPLFVSDNTQFDLALLENSELTGPFALIKENVDGFEDVQFKFVSRAVSHTLSLATSIAADPQDGTSAKVLERTGWGGDGAPLTGSLRDFATGAVAQHLTRDMARVPGSSFRFPTELEKNQLLAFQLALGRTADLDLSVLKLNDARAVQGQGAFTDPMRGRCNHCHGNAGANAIDSGLNRNFGTLTRGPLLAISQADGSYLHDGGFGGIGLLKPNIKTVSHRPDAYGDGTFNTPPLIEAADTGPYFHAHISGSDGTLDIEAAIAFFATTMFARSPAAQELEQRFGAPLTLGGLTGDNIGRFLRVLNAAFNLAIASQRLQAVQALANANNRHGHPIQTGLLLLALEELNDAHGVLRNAPGNDKLHPKQQEKLTRLIKSIRAALTPMQPMSFSPRLNGTLLSDAIAVTSIVKAALGSGLNFELGAGNLMF